MYLVSSEATGEGGMTLECVSSGIWAKACAKTSNRCDTMMRMAFFMMLVLCFLVIVCRFDGELATRYELFQYYKRGERK